IGTVIEPDPLGRLRGNDNARRTEIAHFDADARAVLDWLTQADNVAPGQLGTFGFCLGGHLALRAALNPGVKAAVCCYPTGLHNGKLGRGVADTLDRFGELTAKVLIILGSQDPHVPPEGREAILKALDATGVDHKTLLYQANHTFMRDDGYRYDPVATDQAWGESISFLTEGFA
ncbi:MAG TPA: dienelactone hydrolase family protein, partial [Leptolyngbyaceae cyanobacterium M65_K2018_010]|nr:dienelactone hydrolase family protein [Leptolyngbyaceae cyanobacterium M65_K2018_010]